MSRALPHLCLLLALSACASDPYQPKVRTFDPGTYPDPPARTAGSLLPASGGGLIEDQRPSAVGDVIVIRVDEADSASHDSRTELDRKSDQRYGFTGLVEQIDPDLNLAELFGAQASSDFTGGGRIQKRGRVNAVLPVRVRQILPNGDLYVEGTKTVAIGEDRRHLYVSGIVRPIDVLGDGSVPSSRVADAEIEYVADGDAADHEKRGWLSRLITQLWPF